MLYGTAWRHLVAAGDAVDAEFALLVEVGGVVVGRDGGVLGALDEGVQLLVLEVHLAQLVARLQLLPPDALQRHLVVLLRDARARLPLLDALRQNLIDTAEIIK